MSLKTKRLPKGLKITDSNGDMKGVLYQTEIVHLDRGNQRLTLRCGGWYTVHTKKCINLIFQKYCFAGRVYQKENNWFVSIGTNYITTVPFRDGMVIDL